MNENEIKTRYFASYVGVANVIINKDFKFKDKRYFIESKYIHVLTYSLLNALNCEHDYSIELKPLQSISDEDKKQLDLIEDVADPYQDGYLSYGKTWEDLHYNNGDFHRNLSIKSYQYLQSKGYALPYLNYSVEELVNKGWIKLTTTN